MVMNKMPATNIINNNNGQINGHQNGQLANGKSVDNYAQDLRIEQYKASVFTIDNATMLSNVRNNHTRCYLNPNEFY